MNCFWVVSLSIPLDFPDDVDDFSTNLVEDLEQQTGISKSDADDAFGHRGLSWIFRSDEEAEEFRTIIYSYLEAKNIQLDPEAQDFSEILSSVDKYSEMKDCCQPSSRKESAPAQRGNILRVGRDDRIFRGVHAR